MMRNFTEKKWFSSVVIMACVMLFFTAGCINQRQTVDELIDGQTGFATFSAFKEGSMVRLQFIFSDHKAHTGVGHLTVKNSRGIIQYETDLSVTLEDYADTAKCTEKFCGVEKTYEWQIAASKLGEGDGPYTVEMVFKDEAGMSALAEAPVEVYG